MSEETESDSENISDYSDGNDSDGETCAKCDGALTENDKMHFCQDEDCLETLCEKCSDDYHMCGLCAEWRCVNCIKIGCERGENYNVCEKCLEEDDIVIGECDKSGCECKTFMENECDDEYLFGCKCH